MIIGEETVNDLMKPSAGIGVKKLSSSSLESSADQFSISISEEEMAQKIGDTAKCHP